MTASGRWDERYRAGEHGDDELDRFLDGFLDEILDYRGLLQSDNPTAVDVACGAGRNAVALAAAGFDVTAMDFSHEALRLTVERAAAAGVVVRTRLLDLESPDADLGEGLYDLVAGFYFLHRPLIPKLIAALRPGGLVVYKTFLAASSASSKGPKNPAYRLGPNELLELFSDFRVLSYEEECVKQDSEGPATAALIAQKRYS